MNRYTKYWQAQFEVLAASLEEIEQKRGRQPNRRRRPARVRDRDAKGEFMSPRSTKP
jgi:hypothetical protein